MKKEIFTIAFYNVENFFDTYNDPTTQDDAFTPKGIMRWFKRRYRNKTRKLGWVISQIGRSETGQPPAVIGLSEVENKKVLTDLVLSKYLNSYNYQFIHFDSNDRRGMDVALLFRSDIFNLVHSEVFPLILYRHSGKPYRTRDILYVKLAYKNRFFHFFVNHWPSRREGDRQSDVKRKQAAIELRNLIDEVRYENEHSRLFVMGDFNTNPDDVYLKDFVLSDDFINPFYDLFKQGNFSVKHQNKILLFDQIFFNKDIFEFFNCELIRSNIFSPREIQIWQGKFTGLPYRTYMGLKYKGGYSDHFPVYLILKKGKL